MPENESFWNPYRMIGPQPQPYHDQTTTHEKFQEICGHITGKIRALTPIFVGGKDQGYFFKRNGKYCIPATSFKGMLRSLVEMVGNGCAIVGQGQKPCQDNNNLCAACRLFGMSLPGSRNVLFQGKVYISDLPVVGSPATPQPVEVSPGAPKPEHRAFYRHPCCRKYYYHQRQTWSNIVNRTAQQRMIRNIRPLPVGTEFELNIRCDNMTDAELGLLLYCLELEKDLVAGVEDEDGRPITLHGDLHHKIGGGKPLGYGSVAVEIAPTREDFYEPGQRYRSLGGQASPLSEDRWQKVRTEMARYHLGGDYDSDLLWDVRAMLLFPGQDTPDPRNYKYPGFQWFKENSQVPLKPICRRISQGDSSKGNSDGGQ